ncbi:MAG: Unknown protein [uncultured Thiotrichaceae bacterium]|uniref:Ferrous iron transporter FeoA-like domain-containing protein n=1 Tax=uncultured Thiotrichaceae bacterium TaxID=298394 RepID=A0A6S6TDU7_9GAMM|nr:MAG: Unknown protein [uncultured Thiotrichaceae bacterium]
MTLNPHPTLSSLDEGTTISIAEVKTDSPTRIKLLGMGIGKGCHVQIFRNRSGDMVVGRGNNRISLGRSITQHIFVHTL